MFSEEIVNRLYTALYEKGTMQFYDYFADAYGEGEEFANCRQYADELVDDKLAKYEDHHKTELSITRYGRYWMLHGGYYEFLKEAEHRSRNEKHELKEELQEARLRFTQYRITTFWWNFGFSIFSFVLSLFSLYMVLHRK